MYRHLIVLIVLLCSASSVVAKDTSYISFKKRNEGRTIRFKLPLKCRLYESKDDKRYGKILSNTDSTVIFEYKDYDTSEVNQIMNRDDLKRNEKFDLIDSLIQKTKVQKEIAYNQIYKISILSGSDNLARELTMLGISMTFMGSAIALLFDRGTAVGSKMEWWNWLQIGAIGSSAGALTLLMKRNILMEKWRIVSS